MDAVRWRRAAESFEALCELPVAQREAQLHALQHEDAQLAAYVRELLAADTAGSALDQDAAQLAGELVQEALAGPPPRQGRIGPWRLCARIARGGMGEVYRAVRDDGQFEQQVAIKLLKRGMDSEQILRRFLQERRILARLHHAHIAQLHDGGVTDDGLPYFAMELVDGLPITEYCSAVGSSLAARVALLIDACAAVDFAHRNLVVHRDLKPGNVLVDRAGTVKLLDFGIAKLLDDPLAESLTQTGMRILTPAYAAPEQLRGEPVTTATDVHALGLLLYELLTGRLPPQQDGAVDGPLLPVTRPSTLLRREAPPPGLPERWRLAHDIEGDLDTIVVKALQPEPERRYASPAALAEDLERFCDGRPINARRDSRWYRTRKFVSRHIAAVSTAALVAVALLAGLTAALWQAGLARDHARRAELQAQRADQTRAFVVSLFQDMSPYSSERGAALTAAELLQGAARRVDAELGAQPAEQARLRIVIGSSLMALGQTAQARTLLERGITQLRSLPGVDPVELAGSLQALAQLLEETAEVSLAEQAIVEALALLADGEDEATRLARIRVRSTAAKLLRLRGQRQRAREAYQAVLADRIALLGADDPRLAVDWNNLANIELQDHRHAQAERAFRRAMALLVQDGGDMQPRIAWVAGGLAVALTGRGAYAAAEVALQQAERVAAATLPPGHGMVGSLHNIRASWHLQQGRHAQAAHSGAQAVAILQALDYTEIGWAERNLGTALLHLGRPAEAAMRLADAERHFAATATRPLLPQLAARAARGLALARMGQVADGEAMLRDALRQLADSGAHARSEAGEARLLLAALLHERGAHEAAEREQGAALALLRQALGADHPRLRLLAGAAPVR